MRVRAHGENELRFPRDDGVDLQADELGWSDQALMRAARFVNH